MLDGDTATEKMCQFEGVDCYVLAVDANSVYPEGECLRKCTDVLLHYAERLSMTHAMTSNELKERGHGLLVMALALALWCPSAWYHLVPRELTS